jgi:hypothetical protein
MTRFTVLLLAGVLVPLAAIAPASAESRGALLVQALSAISQPAQGTKTPPPPRPQPGATVGSAADVPAVAAPDQNAGPGGKSAPPSGKPSPLR